MDIRILKRNRSRFSQQGGDGCDLSDRISSLGKGDEPVGQFFCLQAGFFRDFESLFEDLVFVGDGYFCQKDIP